MSIAALNWAWAMECPNATSKLVLLALADRADDDGKCWPGMDTVAARAGVSTRQVSTHMKSLEGMGLLSRVRRRRDDGTLSGYTFRLHVQLQQFDPPEANRHWKQTSTGSAASPPEAERSHHRKSTSGQEPSVEPPVVQVPAADAAPPSMTTVKVDGVDSPMPVKGKGLSKALEAWAEEIGHDRPTSRTWGATTPWLLGLVDGYLGNGKYSHGARMALIGEWVEAVCDKPLPDEAWGHLARLVKSSGGVDAFEAMHTATTSGAGLDGKWRDDPRALTRYAKAVMDNNKEKMDA